MKRKAAENYRLNLSLVPRRLIEGTSSRDSVAQDAAIHVLDLATRRQSPGKHGDGDIRFRERLCDQQRRAVAFKVRIRGEYHLLHIG